MVRSVHVATSLEAAASGPSYTVPALARALARSGQPTRIASISKSPGQFEAHYIVHEAFPASGTRYGVARRLGSSQSLYRHLRHVSDQPVLFHVHGLWRMPSVYPGQIAKTKKLPLVCAPRGMLAPEALAFSTAKKMLFWYAVQRRALSSLTCWHATSEAECEDIRRFGQRQPVAILPNGVDVGKALAITRRTREVLHLGRIHPKKGIDLLLKAWAQIEASHPDWRLRIIGPDEGGHTGDLKALAKRLGLQRVSFDLPLSGTAKREAYRRAALFVLPTRNENFGMVVAEALAEGTPVICTKGAPWQGLETHRCGWWVERDAGILAQTMAAAMATPEGKLSDMGARGRAWMVHDFDWDRIAAKMIDLYCWCRHGGPTPDFVHR